MKFKVLVVDDESSMRSTVAEVLESEGFLVVQASDGREALERVKGEPFDAVVMDVRMPHMDGLQALARIKSIAPEIPVVILTGYGNVKTAVQALQLGAATMLEKPFDNADLVRTVNQAVSGESGGRRPGVIQDDLARQLKGTGRTAMMEEDRLKRRAKTWTGWIVGVGSTAAFIWMLWWGYWAWGWPTKTWSVTFEHPSSLVWEGKTFWVADWVSQEVVQQEIPPRIPWMNRWSPMGNRIHVAAVIKMPGHQWTGLACGSTLVYGCDSQSKKIFRLNKNEGWREVDAVPSPGPNPTGLSWDGAFLWSCDAATRLAYQHQDDDSLTVLATYPLPAKRPLGLVVLSHEAWSFDADQNVVYQHLRDAKLSVVKKYRLPDALKKEVAATFAVREGVLWLLFEGRPSMMAVKLSVLKEEALVL